MLLSLNTDCFHSLFSETNTLQTVECLRYLTSFPKTQDAPHYKKCAPFFAKLSISTRAGRGHSDEVAFSTEACVGVRRNRTDPSSQLHTAKRTECRLGALQATSCKLRVLPSSHFQSPFMLRNGLSARCRQGMALPVLTGAVYFFF